MKGTTRDDSSVLTSKQRKRRQLLKSAAVMAGAVPTLSSLFTATQSATAADDSSARCTDAMVPLRDVAGKVAFITGGSSGIGLGIARALVEAQMKVVIGYRTTQHVEEALALLGNSNDRVRAVNVDVTDRSGMERAATETVRMFGKIHVLVSNAGVNGNASLTRTTYDDWDWIMSVNVGGVFNSIRAFLPHIRSHGEGGHVVATSSVLGLVAINAYGSYTASKFAVVGIMECLRAELSNTRIGVSVFCPGAIPTNIVNADRNRPSNLRESGFQSILPQNAEQTQSRAAMLAETLAAGRLVLRGIRNNDLYILSHANWSELIQCRNDALSASFPMEVDRAFRGKLYTPASDPALCTLDTRYGACTTDTAHKRSNIYALEISRRRCDQSI